MFYGDSQNESLIKIEGKRIPYFYLHGEAEWRNGYDCCNGDYNAFYKSSLATGIFLCKMRLQDGITYYGICITYFKEHRMNGLICIITDIPSIEQVFEMLKTDYSYFPHTIYSDELKILQENHFEVYQLIQKYFFK